MISNIALVVLILFAALGIGSGGLFLKNWVKKKMNPTKHYSYKRISAIVTPEFHDKVKAHATVLDMTITEFILDAVTEKMRKNYND